MTCGPGQRYGGQRFREHAWKGAKLSPRYALPAVGECHLWSVPVRDRPEWEDLLTPAEVARAKMISGRGRRNLFVTSRGAQRLIACRYTGRPTYLVRIDRTCDRCSAADHGRPRVVGARYDYSVAHTHHRVLIGVVSQGFVGIDLETIGNHVFSERLIGRTVTSDEAATLSQLPPYDLPQTFARLWSRKEAAVKLTGHGLAARLDRIGVQDDLVVHEGPPAKDWPSSRIHLVDACVEGHAAAIASTHQITVVVLRSLLLT